MKIITNLRELGERFRKPVVAIGIFDGVHLGHKRILKRVVEKGRRTRGISLVLTFNPHPNRVLDIIGAPPLLVSLRHRLDLIAKEGIEVACVLNFSETLAGYDAEEFVKRLLVKRLGAKAIVVGSNFRFGKNKTGDIKLLREMGKRFGFSVEAVPLFEFGHRAVSSTRVRGLIMRGRLREAAILLGRPVSVLGTVVRGSMRGRLLGYPTANINPHHEAIPPSGVYAVYVIHEGKRYKGILNIGGRPTFRRVPQRVTVTEVHIFGFNSQIYGKDIEVIFVKKLRDEKRFPTKRELLRQIKIDEEKARMVL